MILLISQFVVEQETNKLILQFLFTVSFGIKGNHKLMDINVILWWWWVVGVIARAGGIGSCFNATFYRNKYDTIYPFEIKMSWPIKIRQLQTVKSLAVNKAMRVAGKSSHHLHRIPAENGVKFHRNPHDPFVIENGGEDG